MTETLQSEPIAIFPKPLPRTGILEQSMIVPENAPRGDFDAELMLRLHHSLASALVNCADDGRLYVVKYFEVEENLQATDEWIRNMKSIRQRAVIALHHRVDAEVGEHCLLEFAHPSTQVCICADGREYSHQKAGNLAIWQRTK